MSSFVTLKTYVSSVVVILMDDGRRRRNIQSCCEWNNVWYINFNVISVLPMAILFSFRFDINWSILCNHCSFICIFTYLSINCDQENNMLKNCTSTFFIYSCFINTHKSYDNCCKISPLLWKSHPMAYNHTYTLFLYFELYFSFRLRLLFWKYLFFTNMNQYDEMNDIITEAYRMTHVVYSLIYLNY
jgi:hypothetical protein